MKVRAARRGCGGSEQPYLQTEHLDVQEESSAQDSWRQGGRVGANPTAPTTFVTHETFRWPKQYDKPAEPPPSEDSVCEEVRHGRRSG
jgi:hypothetical protein